MLKEKLQAILKGDVADSEDVLLKYSRDASLFEIRPQVVAFPKDAEDIKQLVLFASENKGVSFTPRSGGTDMSGGAIGESVILDFTKYFNHIRNVGEGVATAEPGVYYRDFEVATLKKGWLLPSYPASKDICALGGMVANNSGGEKTLRYGKTEDYIKELKMVLRDGNEYIFKPLSTPELNEKIKLETVEGEVYREIFNLITQNRDAIMAAKPKVSKNSAGYYLWNVWDGQTFDITKLIVGSQGTLGIITEITFKLVKPAKYSKLLAIFLKDTKNLPEVVSRVMRHKPESFEAFDDNTLKLALRYVFSLIKLIKPKNIFALAWNFLPEFWMLLAGGVPKMILLAEFTGSTEAEVDAKAILAENEVRDLGIKTRFAKTTDESKKYWTIRRESFNLLRYHIKNKRTAPFIEDIVVRVEKLPEFLPQLQTILDKYKNLNYTIAGHVGDGNFHIIPLMDMSQKENRDIIPALSQEVYGLVFQYAGSTTGEHNDGLVRGPYLRAMFGDEIYSLFERVKNIFDPAGIFNPGKKVGSSLDYAVEHLATKNK